MGKRKTIEVNLMVDWANKQLSRNDEYADTGFKVGVCTTLEAILRETGNYNGFMFLDSNDCEINTLGYFSRKYFSK
jgi:hypothetical protein